MESSRTFKIKTSMVKANILPELFFFLFKKRLEVTNFCYIVQRSNIASVNATIVWSVKFNSNIVFSYFLHFVSTFIQFYDYSHPSKFFITYKNPRLLFNFIDEIFFYLFLFLSFFFFFEFIRKIHADLSFPNSYLILPVKFLFIFIFVPTYLFNYSIHVIWTFHSKFHSSNLSNKIESSR